MQSSARKTRTHARTPEAQTARREAILEAAATAFAERGYVNAEMQEIADSLGVGKGTIYRYFVNKEDLFAHALQWRMESMHKQALYPEQWPSDPVDQLAVHLSGFLRFFDENPDVVELLVQERAHLKHITPSTFRRYWDATLPATTAKSIENLQQWQVTAYTAEEVIDAIADLLYGALFKRYLLGEETKLETKAKLLAGMVMNGLRDSKGK